MTVTATRAPFHLLIGGVWVHLEGISPGVSVPVSRPRSSRVTLGGSVWTQQAARANRQWSFSFPWSDAEAGRWLDYAATNPGEVWMSSQIDAQINMLPVADTKGRLSIATLIPVDGVLMKAFSAADGFTRKVRNGVAYHLSYTTIATAGATIGTYNYGAGSVNIVAPAGSGARRGSVSFIPSADGAVVGSWTVANKTTAARLSESSVDDFGWLEGRNTPCMVSVQDGQTTWNQAYADQPGLGDTTYVVQEIG